LVGFAGLSLMVLEIYPDSSFLFSLLAKDRHTPEASRYLVRTRVPLFFTPLHRVEVRNALRNAAGRKEITDQECRAAFRLIETRLQEQLFVHAAVEWTNIFRRADELSEKHSSQGGQRTIDLLHVAIAMDFGAKIFLSFDQRQKKLAKVAGLKAKP
jgi:predicted nucleic acid-binding protein